MSDHSTAAEMSTIYIDEVQGHDRRLKSLMNLTHSSTKAAAFMLLAAIVALIVANTPAHEPFLEFWHMEFGFVLDGEEATLSLAHIINDICMAIFFLLVGLEIKYEMTVGDLTDLRQALLPVVAAVGGVVVPIIIYLIFNGGEPEAAMGWGVPTATDIAFALGIMALLGNRVPNGIRVFLSTLAVADDIIAILVIAIFYGESPSILWLALTAAVFVVLIIMNRLHIYSLTAYMLVGVVLWYCVFMSGVHATIAGVLLAFTIPTGSRVKLKSFVAWSTSKINSAKEDFDAETPVSAQSSYLHTVSELGHVSKQVVPPATRLEHMLYPWVYFAILPLFALTNADVSFGGDVGAVFSNPVMWGVFFGLLLGKPIGITLFSFVVIKMKVANLPEHSNWMHMIGASVLGGVGFTMAIFVANLAYADEALITAAKVGILTASALAGIIGLLLLATQAKEAKDHGVVYLATNPDQLSLGHDDEEAVKETRKILEDLHSVEVSTDVAESSQASGSQEVVVELFEESGHTKVVVNPDDIK